MAFSKCASSPKPSTMHFTSFVRYGQMPFPTWGPVKSGTGETVAEREA